MYWLTRCPVMATLKCVKSSRTTVTNLVALPSSAPCPLSSLILIFDYWSGQLEYLRAPMNFVRQHAWAPNTKKAQSSQIRIFLRYAELANLSTLPLSGTDLAFYAMWLIMEGRVKTAGSLAQYLSAVRQYHLRRKSDCPTPSQFGPLQQVLKGMRRLAQHRVKKSKPVTPKILRNLLRSQLHNPLCARQRTTLTVYKTLCLIYYLSMLRSSSLIMVDSGKMDPKRILCWGRVRNLDDVTRRSVVLKVGLSKTNQYNGKEHLAPLTWADEPLFCPIRSLDRLRVLYGPENCGPDTPVFRVPDAAGRFVPVQRHKFNKWFMDRLGQMGADPSEFTLHGFRHGGIQEVLLAESNYALCRLSSDHSSDAIMEYAELPPERRLNIALNVNKGLAASAGTSSAI